MFNSLDTSSLFNFDQVARRNLQPVNTGENQPVINPLNNQDSDIFISAGNQNGDSEAPISPLEGSTYHTRRLIRTLRSSSDANLRREAAIALGEIIRNPQTTEPSFLIQPQTALRLTQQPPQPQAEIALITALREDPDASVRREAAISLALGGRGKYREDRGNYVVRYLDRRYSSPQILAALARVLREDPDTSVRREAAISLGDCSQEGAEVLITTALGENIDLSIRREAITSLGELRATRAVVTALMIALREPDADIRRRAARSLERLGGLQHLPQAIPALITALSDPNVDVRVSAASALGYMRGASGRRGESPEAVAALIRVFRDPDSHPSVRRAAVLSLGTQSSPEAIEELGVALSDRDPEVVGVALYGFRSSINRYLVSQTAQNALARFINNTNDEENRNYAIEGLCRIARERSNQVTDEQFRILTNALRSENENVSLDAERTLIALSGRSVPYIVEQFGNGISSATLMDILAEIGPPAISNLYRALEHENPIIRANSAQVLAQIGRNSNMPAVTNQDELNSIVESIYYLALLDPDRTVREVACNALGSMGRRGTGALRVLEIIAEEDRNGGVRYHARQAINMIQRNRLRVRILP